MRYESTPRICQYPGCGTELTARHQRRFCSHSCASKFKWDAGQLNRTRVSLTCDACGVTFTRHLSETKKAARKGSKTIYCSKQCENHLKSSTNVEMTCPHCKEPFTRWASSVARAKDLGQIMYCSAKCRDRATSESPKSPSGWARWGHREDLGHFVRSSWEANVCRLLLALGIPYEYEPRAFRLPSGTSYRPDLLVAGFLWIEVKGWMSSANATKLAEFRAAYPAETLLVLDKDIYVDICKVVADVIPGWE